MGEPGKPDGRWLAYISAESGRFEVYVEPSRGTGGRVRVSGDGGGQPRWRADGSTGRAALAAGRRARCDHDPVGVALRAALKQLLTADMSGLVNDPGRLATAFPAVRAIRGALRK